MVSEQATRAYNIFKVIETISGSRVFKATIKFLFKDIFTFDWNDQLGDYRKHFCSTFFKHIKDTLYWEESIWILLLTDSFEKDRKIMMIIKLLNLNLPINAVLGSMLNRDRKISSVIESSELRWWNLPVVECTSDWLLLRWPLLGIVQAHSLYAKKFYFL